MESTGGAYARAIEEATKEFQAAVPAVMAKASGVEFREARAPGETSVFRVPLMDAVLDITYPEGAVTSDGKGAVVAIVVVALHYLARSVGPLDLSEPVRFAGLPGASAYAVAFRSHTEVPLLQRFGEDGAGFVAAVSALGGVPDGGREHPEAAWEVPFFPHLPLGVRLGLAEDAMPAECVITFPRRCGFVYHVEDLAVIGELFAARLLEVAEAVPRAEGHAEPVRLTTLFSRVEADLVVAKLRSAEIEAIVQSEALSVVFGLTMDGHARLHVLVRPEDLAEARGVLDTEGVP